MTDDTSAQVLAAPIESEEAETVGEYLQVLLETLWLQHTDFNGKRPFGNSSWRYEIYEALIGADLIRGTLDDNGYVMALPDDEQEKGDQLIINAINYVFSQRESTEEEAESRAD